MNSSSRRSTSLWLITSNILFLILGNSTGFILPHLKKITFIQVLWKITLSSEMNLQRWKTICLSQLNDRATDLKSCFSPTCNRRKFEEKTAEEKLERMAVRQRLDWLKLIKTHQLCPDVYEPPSTNMTTNNNQTQQDMAGHGRIWQNERLVYSSFMLNVVFMITGESVFILWFTSLCIEQH